MNSSPTVRRIIEVHRLSFDRLPYRINRLEGDLWYKEDRPPPNGDFLWIEDTDGYVLVTLRTNEVKTTKEFDYIYDAIKYAEGFLNDYV